MHFDGEDGVDGEGLQLRPAASMLKMKLISIKQNRIQDFDDGQRDPGYHPRFSVVRLLVIQASSSWRVDADVGVTTVERVVDEVRWS